MKTTTAVALALTVTAACAACTRVQAMDPQQVERQYGLSGAFTDTITTTDGPLTGTLVPITLADGQQAHLFIPQRQASDLQTVYVRDAEGLHPVQLADHTTREQVARAPAIVQQRPPQRAPQPAARRSWEREVLIVGGGAGAGALIGGLAGGKKGAGVGAASGGVGALIYDMATRNKKK